MIDNGADITELHNKRPDLLESLKTQLPVVSEFNSALKASIRDIEKKLSDVENRKTDSEAVEIEQQYDPITRDEILEKTNVDSQQISDPIKSEFDFAVKELEQVRSHNFTSRLKASKLVKQVVNYQDGGKTLLMLALKLPTKYSISKKDIIAEILSKNPDLSLTDNNGQNAIHYFAESDINLSKDIDLSEKLKAALKKQNKDEQSKSINAKDNNNKTPLQIAIDNNKYDVIKILLEHDADITESILPLRNKLPIIRNYDFGLAQLIEQKLSIIEKKEIDAQFDSAMNSKDTDELKKFIFDISKNPNIEYGSYIKKIIDKLESNKMLEIINHCLKLKINIPESNSEDKNKIIQELKENCLIINVIKSIKENNISEFTSLSENISKDILDKQVEDGTSIFTAAYLYDDECKIIKLLKTKYSDIDFTISNSTEFNNIIHLAVKHEKCDKLNLILESKYFDVNAKDTNGKTPLFIAIENGLYDIAKLLLKNDAIIGKGYIEKAKERDLNNVILLLETHQLSNLIKNSNDNATDLENLKKGLLKKFELISKIYDEGKSIKDLIIEYKNIELLRWLIKEQKIDKDEGLKALATIMELKLDSMMQSNELHSIKPILDDCKNSGIKLSYAISTRLIDKLLTNEDHTTRILLESLSKYNININQTEEETQQTILHKSVIEKNSSKVKELIRLGADKNLKDKNNKKPEDLIDKTHPIYTLLNPDTKSKATETKSSKARGKR